MRSRHILTAFLALTTFTLSAVAQDVPVIATVLAASVAAWPQTGAIQSGAHLFITTFAEPNTTYPCQFRSLDAARITCIGQHGAPDTGFERSTISNIVLAPHHHLRPSTVLLTVGIACLFVSFLILINHAGAGGTGGGVANGDLAQVGLTAVIAGGITRFFDGHSGSGPLVPIYIAPRPTAPAQLEP